MWRFDCQECGKDWGKFNIGAGHDLDGEANAMGLGQALTEGLVMGSYRLQHFKSKNKKISLERIRLVCEGEFKKGVLRGFVLGRQIASLDVCKTHPPIECVLAIL